MRYAIISDVHSNFEALEAVLRRIDLEKCDSVICLGDIVGYGPFPNECITRMMALADTVIMGNHDHAAVGLTDTAHFNIYARLAMDWTRLALAAENREIIRCFCTSVTKDDCYFVHATPQNPLEWQYLLHLPDAGENFPFFVTKMCFIGHSHIPIVFCQTASGKVQVLQMPEIDLQTDSRYIINVGSVGQPRDGDPRSCFVIFDSASGRLQYIRTEYDVGKTQKQMRLFSLPEFLIQRLIQGY